jgi:hypothetical protein
VNFTQEAPEGGLPIRFALPGGGVLALQAFAGSLSPAPAANAVTPIALTWQSDAAPSILTASVRLTDDLGQIWAQHDYEPLGGQDANWTRTSADERGQVMATDRLGLLIPAGTPPGRYHVELVVQPKAAGRPLDALASDGRSLGTAARLFDLDVSAANRGLDPERLPIGTREEVVLGDGLRFLGYATDDLPATPGDLRKVSLFWQATAAPSTDYAAFVQLLGPGGNAIPLWEAPPGAAHPTSRWAPGTLMRTQAAFRVPASLPDGRYRLIAGLFRPGDGARLRTPSGADHVSLGVITVRGREHDMTPPQPQHPADATFGDVARLVGYDMDGSAAVARGASFPLTLYWQAQAPSDRAYTVFVHLLDETGTIRGYGDSEPGGGAFPTPGWLAGEYLADGHTVTVAADAPGGKYRVALGFYDPTAGKRLKTPDGADQWVLDAPITVR